MKKITLSAAIMALAMMGCSDAGLDNSVASTNEVKNEQTQNFLAKINAQSENIVNVPLSEGAPGVGDGYQFVAYPHAGLGIQVQTRVDLDWDGYEGQGEFFVAAAPFPPQ